MLLVAQRNWRKELRWILNPQCPAFQRVQRKINTGRFIVIANKDCATDRRASKVGDLLTVALSENFRASKSQSAKSAKNGTASFDFPRITTAGADDNLFDSTLAKSFDGSGSADQTNSLRGEISVTVTKVFSNGNMEILGQKKLTLNNGDEYIRLVGIIRPEDVDSRNIVPSSRIANAKISYTGAGDLADTSKKGWLSKLVDVVTPL